LGHELTLVTWRNRALGSRPSWSATC
jgi:hypothetical protein